MAVAAGSGEPSLHAAGILGPVCQVWALGGQYSSAAGTGEPSLQIVGNLGPAGCHGLPGAMEASALRRNPSLW
jgi:hypothetical protein